MRTSASRFQTGISVVIALSAMVAPEFSLAASRVTLQSPRDLRLQSRVVLSDRAMSDQCKSDLLELGNKLSKDFGTCVQTQIDSFNKGLGIPDGSGNKTQLQICKENGFQELSSCVAVTAGDPAITQKFKEQCKVSVGFSSLNAKQNQCETAAKNVTNKCAEITLSLENVGKQASAQQEKVNDLVNQLERARVDLKKLNAELKVKEAFAKANRCSVKAASRTRVNSINPADAIIK